MSRFAQVKIVEPQSEEINKNVDITESEAEALLYKYSPDTFKEQEIQKKVQNQPQKLKKFDADEDSIPNGDYYDVKYHSEHLEGEDFQQELNIKIEIKSNIPL